MSTWHISGFILGLLFGLAVVAGVWHLYRRLSVKNSSPAVPDKFDERQQRYRGMAYKWGFYTLCFYLVALGCIEIVVHKLPGDFLTLSFLGIALSFTVFAFVCIRYDAYLKLWEKPKGVIAIFLLLAVFNISIGLVNINNGYNVVFLDYHYINLICGLMLVVILVYFIARNLSRSKDEE